MIPFTLVISAVRRHGSLTPLGGRVKGGSEEGEIGKGEVRKGRYSRILA